MLNVRTCRICGCWELRACPGGCAWATADRCTACPANGEKILPINAHHVAAATLDVVAEVELPGGIISRSGRAREFPRLIVTKTVRGGCDVEVTAFVGALTMPDPDDLRAIADLLNLPEAA